MIDWVGYNGVGSGGGGGYWVVSGRDRGCGCMVGAELVQWVLWEGGDFSG